MAAVEVHCSNCGGSAGSIGLVLSVTALAIAFVSLYFTWRGHRRAELEHHEFLDEIRRRAQFDLTLRLQGDDEGLGVIETDATVTYRRLQIGLKNVGTRAAGPTLINVLAPDWVADLRWADPRGGPAGGGLSNEPVQTSETLRAPDGAEHRAHYIAREFPRIGLRPAHVMWAQFSFSTPPNPAGSSQSIPFRVVAQADELPDEVDEVRAEIVVRAVRPPVGG